MDNNRLPKIALHGCSAFGVRLVGGQEMSYRRCIHGDLKMFDLLNAAASNGKVYSWQRIARTRTTWRRFLHSGRSKAYVQWLADREKKKSDTNTDYVAVNRSERSKADPVYTDLFEGIAQAMDDGAITTRRKKKMASEEVKYHISWVKQCMNEVDLLMVL